MTGGLVQPIPPITFLKAERDTTPESQQPPDYVDCDELPQVITQLDPDRLSNGLNSEVHGLAWVKMWVSKEGNVRAAAIMHSDNTLINLACLRAAVQWTFTIPSNKGIPVELWIARPFKL